MAAAAATLRVNTSEADRAAAELAAQGAPLAEICARFDPLISPQTARAAIARGRHALDQERPKPVPPTPTPPIKPQPPVFMGAVQLPAPAAAPPVAPLADPEPEPRPEPQSAATAPQEPKPKPKVTVPLEADELLAWAERDGTARARTLASRVRIQLAELGAIHATHAQTSEMRRFVAVLEKNLADAKAELKRLTSGSAAPPAATATAGAPAGASTSEIRAWARETGLEVPDRGRIPGHIADAYRTAHAA